MTKTFLLSTEQKLPHEFAKKLIRREEDEESTLEAFAFTRARTPRAVSRERETRSRAQTDRFTRTHHDERDDDDESGLGGCVDARRKLCRACGRETKKNILVVVVRAWPPRLEWRRSSPPR